MIQKILFFFFVIVIAFLPGGIFISIFLLALYYLAPTLTSNNFQNEEVDVYEYKIHLELSNLMESSEQEKRDMQSYSKETLEEMK